MVMIKQIYLILCLLLFLAACGKEVLPLTERIELTNKLDSSLVIWKESNSNWRLISDIGINKIDEKLVMVRYVPFTKFAHYLSSLPENLKTYQTPTSHYALVDLSSPQLRDEIARLAHTHLNGLACGRLEPLQLSGIELTTSQPSSIYPSHQKLSQVLAPLSEVDQDFIETQIKTLQDLGSRHHSLNGTLNTSQHVSGMLTSNATSISDFQINEINHSSTPQKSLIAKIPGQNPDGKVVIIGAHIDSIIKSSGDQSYAPGADDDASGVAVMIQILKIINDQGLKFERDIEFHGYAAEEVGLLGSSAIAKSYADEQKQVAAMLQLDMVAYSAKEDTTIYLVENDTNADLRRSLKDLLNTYLGGNFEQLSLIGGTSDHKSWSLNGYPAVFPFENPQAYNQSLHTKNDTLDTINSLALAARFAQLGLAYLSHHAGLTAAKTEAESASSDTDDDLKVALFAETSGDYSISIAGPKAITTVEICFVSSNNLRICQDARIQADLKNSIGERNIFVIPQSLALNAENRISIFGYNSKEELVLQRVIRLATK